MRDQYCELFRQLKQKITKLYMRVRFVPAQVILLEGKGSLYLIDYGNLINVEDKSYLLLVKSLDIFHLISEIFLFCDKKSS